MLLAVMLAIPPIATHIRSGEVIGAAGGLCCHQALRSSLGAAELGQPTLVKSRAPATLHAVFPSVALTLLRLRSVVRMVLRVVGQVCASSHLPQRSVHVRSKNDTISHAAGNVMHSSRVMHQNTNTASLTARNLRASPSTFRCG